MEGKVEEARKVVEVEMPDVGVIPNERTTEVLEIDSERWNRMRTSHLGSLLKRNDVDSAWTFFDTLVENSEANETHFTVMMKACETSTQKRDLMEYMVEHNVRPDVVTYTMLVNQLMIEGKVEEARKVVEVEMPDVGVIPNERTTEFWKKAVRYRARCEQAS